MGIAEQMKEVWFVDTDKISVLYAFREIEWNGTLYYYNKRVGGAYTLLIVAQPPWSSNYLNPRKSIYPNPSMFVYYYYFRQYWFCQVTIMALAKTWKTTLSIWQANLLLIICISVRACSDIFWRTLYLSVFINFEIFEVCKIIPKKRYEKRNS